MLLGAHVSIAGGVSNAPIFGREATCDSIQIFTKNQMQWKVPELSKNEVRLFKLRSKEFDIKPAVIHSSYLVNIASYDETILERSINDLALELERADALGIDYVAFHPGAHKGTGEERGIKRISRSIDVIFSITKSKRAKLLLETTAGEGSVLGFRFDQLAWIIEHVKNDGRVAVCLDTCHVFAAGYDIRTKASCERVISDFDSIIGLNKLKVFHLNDCKFDLGSRMDRHEEIGKGKIGLEAFRFFVNDIRFKNTPGILEIPGDIEGYRRNLKILRSLINGKNFRKR